MSGPDPDPDGVLPSPQEFRATASLAVLQRRHQLLTQTRQFFADRGFLEVTTPLLASEVIVDRCIEPFRVTAFPDPRHPEKGPHYFLQTSPELHMKRLLASGATAIYQVTQAFRAMETGAVHNPEFTLVEWYRIGDDLDRGIELLGDLVGELLQCPRPVRRTYREVFQQFAGFDPFSIALADLRHRLGPLAVEGGDRDDLLNMALDSLVQPRLRGPCPTIVSGFPLSQAALARRDTTDPDTARRFELFHQGMELANGYDELMEANELEARLEEANRQRQAARLPAFPLPKRLLAAVRAGIAPCTGVALGFDRLVMLATEQASLPQVVPFPWSTA